VCTHYNSEPCSVQSELEAIRVRLASDVATYRSRIKQLADDLLFRLSNSTVSLTSSSCIFIVHMHLTVSLKARPDATMCLQSAASYNTQVWVLCVG
jgi:hypothetical protein